MSPTKHDVALAEVTRKANREAIAVKGIVAVAAIAASYLPLTALQGIVDLLAGETTRVDFNLGAMIAVALSVSLSVMQGLRGRSRQSELEERIGLGAEREQAWGNLECIGREGSR